MTTDVDEIRAALAAATPGNGTPADQTLGHMNLRAFAPTWLAALCDEVELLRAENDKDTDRIAVLVWDRDAALAECERLRSRTNGDSVEAEHVAGILAADRDAALARIAELDESIADFQQLAVDRTAERDAALAEIQSLGALLAHSQKQRDAALKKMDAADAQCRALGAEVERLRAVVESQAEHIGMGDQIAEEDKAEVERLRADTAVWIETVNKSAELRLAWRACAEQLAASIRTPLGHYDLAKARMVKAEPLREALARFDALKAGES